MDTEAKLIDIMAFRDNMPWPGTPDNDVLTYLPAPNGERVALTYGDVRWLLDNLCRLAEWPEISGLMEDLDTVRAERSRYKMWWEAASEGLGEVMHENAQNRCRAEAMYKQVKKFRFLLDLAGDIAELREAGMTGVVSGERA